jgi:hypothetical protein
VRASVPAQAVAPPRRASLRAGRFAARREAAYRPKPRSRLPQSGTAPADTRPLAWWARRGANGTSSTAGFGHCPCRRQSLLTMDGTCAVSDPCSGGAGREGPVIMPTAVQAAAPSLLAGACAAPAAKPGIAPARAPSGPPDPMARLVPTSTVTHQIRAIDADASRSTLVTLTGGGKLAVIREGRERSWPITQLIESGACGVPSAVGPGMVRVGISTDGQQAWFVGIDGRKANPTYVQSAACLVDAESGAARSLRAELGEPRHLPRMGAEGSLPFITLGREVAVLSGGGTEPALVWRGSRSIEPLDIGTIGQECTAVEAGVELTAACIGREGHISLARSDISGSPSRRIVRHDVYVHAKQPKIQLSADGRFLAFHEAPALAQPVSVIGVVDASNGHPMFEGKLRRVQTVEFVFDDSTLLVADDDTRVLLFGTDGIPRGRFTFDCSPRHLFAAKGRHVWCDGHGDLALYAY